ncbi:MAG: hypothetical protein U1D55_05270 [Phycisphaerae bacterium]
MPKTKVVVEERPPRVATGLLVTLVLAALAAGAYWGYSTLRPADAAPAAMNDLLQAETTMYCAACSAEMQLKVAELQKMKVQDGKYQCPKCGQFSGVFSKPPPKDAPPSPQPKISVETGG